MLVHNFSNVVESYLFWKVIISEVMHKDNFSFILNVVFPMCFVNFVKSIKIMI